MKTSRCAAAMIGGTAIDPVNWFVQAIDTDDAGLTAPYLVP
jgi:hypothetical protein